MVLEEKVSIKKELIAAGIFILVVAMIIVTFNCCGKEDVVEPVETTTTSTTIEDTYVPKLPYVGMSEDKINSTELGPAYREVRHNYECIGGNQYLANIYDFKDELGIVIFSARCVRGEVTEVWDTRDAILTYGQDRYTYSRTTSTTKTTRYSYSGYQYGSYKTTTRKYWTTKKTTKKYDPYNAKDFYDAEDFYDEHYDDFFDFEDAEDYWYDHGY